MVHVRRWLQRGFLTCENFLCNEHHRMNSSWLCSCLRCVCFLFWQKTLHSTDLWCHIFAGVFLDDSCWFYLIFNCFTKPCKSGSFSRTRWGNIIPVNFLRATGMRFLFEDSPDCGRLAKHIWRLPKIFRDVLFCHFLVLISELFSPKIIWSTSLPFQCVMLCKPSIFLCIFSTHMIKYVNLVTCNKR